MILVPSMPLYFWKAVNKTVLVLACKSNFHFCIFLLFILVYTPSTSLLQYFLCAYLGCSSYEPCWTYITLVVPRVVVANWCIEFSFLLVLFSPTTFRNHSLCFIWWSWCIKLCSAVPNKNQNFASKFIANKYCCL